jgi:hypothetical protein
MNAFRELSLVMEKLVLYKYRDGWCAGTCSGIRQEAAHRRAEVVRVSKWARSPAFCMHINTASST